MPRVLRLYPLLAAFAALALAAGFALIRPAGASAHPLGNFTVNHYTRIDVTAEGIELFRVLEMAEIPAFQERQRIDADGDGEVSAAESDSYGAAQARRLAEGMTLRAGDDEVELTETLQTLSFPEGQGGLSLLRLEVTYTGALPADWRDGPLALTFDDRNDTDRIGWREVVVRGGPGVEIASSDVPSEDISGALLSYPEASLSSPLDVRTAVFAVAPGAGAPLPATARDADRATRANRGNPDSTLTRFADLAGKDNLTPGVIAIALLGAVGFGALHALSPGHGKTVVAAYLVGSRGTPRHALLLGLTVTITHTSTVYLLGFITLYLSEYIVPETLYPWLGIISGALILLMGAMLLYGRLRASGFADSAFGRVRAIFRQPQHRPALVGESGALTMALPAGPAMSHQHPHEAHIDLAHDFAATAGAHSHGIGPAHSHAIPGQDGEPVTWRSLIGLGIFGGMIPCPSAIVVMLSAIALHRVAFGLVLILAFSVGLAAVLTGIGFALVYARTLTERVPQLKRLAEKADRREGLASLAVRAFPIASAAAVVIAGAVITLRALSQQGTI